MNKALAFISHSSLFISLCATSLSFYYSIMTGTEISPYRLILIFAGTLLSYIGVQLIPLSNNKFFTDKSIWHKENKIILISLMLASVFGILTSIRYLTQFELLNYTHLFIIVLFYEKIVTSEKELRKIPYLKPFLISYIWACVCTAPQINTTANSDHLYMWLECFVFILSLTIPFDIRDIEYDHNDGIKTLATRFQLKHVKLFVFITYITAFLISFTYLPINTYNLLLTIVLIIVYILLLSRTWPNQKQHYFLYGFDGLIIAKLLYLIN